MSEWVQGDGGPVIVVQEAAASLWGGVADSEQSHMEGGDLRTDYDVICEAAELSAIRHHDRDMLVLSDCSWRARLFALPEGGVGVLQVYGTDRSQEELIATLRAQVPHFESPFEVRDRLLRLQVGADPGDDVSGGYGQQELKVEPGSRRCEIYFSDEGVLALIRGT